MKMRVRGYNEHRLKDPYKFWSKLLDTPPRRAKRCVAQYTYVTRIDESTLQFTYGKNGDEHWPDREFCLLSSNDVWTFTRERGDILPGLANRYHALTGCKVVWDKKTFSLFENPCRLYYGSLIKSCPYERGVQIYKGQPLELEKYVDRKRTIERDSALEIKRKLKKIYELAPIMVRLLEAQGDRKPIHSWTPGYREMKRELFEKFDPDNVTALDAEQIYLIGEAVTQKKQRWVWNGSNTQHIMLETEAEYRKRCIVNGLRKIREHVYSKEGVYQFEPVKS